MLSAAQSCASMLHHVLLYESAAALSLVVTALIVAAPGPSCVVDLFAHMYPADSVAEGTDSLLAIEN